jgi:hypothetical protein
MGADANRLMISPPIGSGFAAVFVTAATKLSPSYRRFLCPTAIAAWRKVTLGFNSGERERVRTYAGVWGGREGRFWIDDLRIEEVGLVNVVRRPGTPLAVRSDENDNVYEEGVDFQPVGDPILTFRFDHDGPAIRLLPNSRIRNGERLRVSYYHGQSINDGQVSICMSEPEVYDIWATQARLLREHLAPRRFLLSMDEIRMGGSCEACKRRQMSMAQILGDSVTRQVNLLREAMPEIEVLTWSDMLDPNHNARNNYYLVEGDYTGSWEHVPRDLVVMCWYYAQRRASLKHFSELGFRTMAGAYSQGIALRGLRALQFVYFVRNAVIEEPIAEIAAYEFNRRHSLDPCVVRLPEGTEERFPPSFGFRQHNLRVLDFAEVCAAQLILTSDNRPSRIRIDNTAIEWTTLGRCVGVPPEVP